MYKNVIHVGDRAMTIEEATPLRFESLLFKNLREKFETDKDELKTGNGRFLYFHPISSLKKYQGQRGNYEKIKEEFKMRFLMWVILYVANEQVQVPCYPLWCHYDIFAHTVYRKYPNTPFYKKYRHTHITGTHRSFLKTFITNCFHAYRLIYGAGGSFTIVLSPNNDSINQAYDTVSGIITDTKIVSDCGERPLRISKQMIIGQKDTGFMARTFEQYDRGEYFGGRDGGDGKRPDFVNIDDCETNAMVESPTQFSKTLNKYQGTIKGSLSSEGAIILVNNNYIDNFNFTKYFIDTADTKIIVPLWTSPTPENINQWHKPEVRKRIEKTLTWKSRYSWNGGVSKISVKQMIEDARRDHGYGGEMHFRREFLCDPSSVSKTYYNMNLVFEKSPNVKYTEGQTYSEVTGGEKIEFDDIIYNVYGPLNEPDTTMIFGLDYGTGSGHDSTVVIGISVHNNTRKCKHVFTGFSNNFDELYFIETTLKFLMSRVGLAHLQNYTTWSPERSTAGGSVTVNILNENNIPIFTDMASQDLDLKDQRRSTRWGVQKTSKNTSEIHMLAKEYLETGIVETLCPMLMNEISILSSADAVHRRRLTVPVQETFQVTKHYDVLSAFEVGCVALRGHFEDVKDKVKREVHNEQLRVARGENVEPISPEDFRRRKMMEQISDSLGL